MNNFNSYCWHPSRNIIFYVKRETDADGAIRYPIYYYDFDDKKSKPIKMDILTDNNKYLSISNGALMGCFFLILFKNPSSNEPSEKATLANLAVVILKSFE